MLTSSQTGHCCIFFAFLNVCALFNKVTPPIAGKLKRIVLSQDENTDHLYFNVDVDLDSFLAGPTRDYKPIHHRRNKQVSFISKRRLCSKGSSSMDLIQISNMSNKTVSARRTIRFTQSICPDCNMILDAEVFEREGKVFMTKTCPTHGE